MKKKANLIYAIAFLLWGFNANAQIQPNLINGHEYVDLGLPSGLLWATYNVGAQNPEEYGNYFAWGEIEPKEIYNDSTLLYFDHETRQLSKYCTDSYFGTLDSLETLQPEDDAATNNWGYLWRTPTMEEMKELRNNCNWEWTDNFRGSEIAGRIGMSKKNGKIIFFPAAGFKRNIFLSHLSRDGFYWSASIYASATEGCYEARYFYISPEDVEYSTIGARNVGLPIRAVAEKE